MEEQLDLGFGGEAASAPLPQPAQAEPMDAPSEEDHKLVEKIIKTVKADKQRWKKDFRRMRKNMQLARVGASKEWAEKGMYTANITGRHINQSVAALYAKNPKVVARRRERMDFALWDENPQSMMDAFMLVEQMTTMAAQVQQTPVVDEMTGQPVTDEMGQPVMPPPPVMPPEFESARLLLEDIQEGLATRATFQKLGKTLEILFNYYAQEQSPLDFQTAMKQAVRRAKTCKVAYVRLGFQRVMQPQPVSTGVLGDATEQFDHLRRLAEDQASGKLENKEAEQRELFYAQQTMSQQQEIILREGPVFDWPESTRVIPDKLCRAIVGFIGCRHLTVEFLYTVEEVQELFGVDLKKGDTSETRSYTPYTSEGNEVGEDKEKPDDGLVCVWEHFDKPSGNVYYVCDGYKGFLKPPGPPDVLVEGFWPIRALCFNQIEDSEEVFPPSDVELIESAQIEYNRLRQGLSEHRKAARPRFMSSRGAMTEDDKEGMATAEPFTVLELDGLNPGEDLSTKLQPFQMPGVDPNLYLVAEAFQDVQLTVGASESSFGMAGKATATGESLAEGSRTAAVSSNVDDLDSFLSAIARDVGQIMLRNLNEETVKKIAGRGAVWPQLTLAETFEEIGLEIEAGSSGRPNQAQDIANWEKLLPMLVQLPGIQPGWIARKTIQTLDAAVDITEAFAEGLPSIVSMNRMSQAQPADPNADPAAQGEEGAENGPPPPGGPAGTDAPMGNNQV